MQKDTGMLSSPHWWIIYQTPTWCPERVIMCKDCADQSCNQKTRHLNHQILNAETLKSKCKKKNTINTRKQISNMTNIIHTCIYFVDSLCYWKYPTKFNNAYLRIYFNVWEVWNIQRILTWLFALCWTLQVVLLRTLRGKASIWWTNWSEN